jgi:general secretion pathway protein G
MHTRKNVPACRQQRRCGTRQQAPRAGFTLLELLLVLAILVVVGGIVVVNIGGVQEDANADTTRIQMNELKKVITIYKIRMNSLPDALDDLVEGPSDAAKKAKWSEPLMPEIPADAWENELVYSRNGNTYEIRSGGSDGQVNTDDDIVVTGP